MEEQLTISHKKRGRKPSNKTQVPKLMIPQPTAPKKRGRKPKDKLGVIDNNTKILTEENVILHLPISDDEETINDKPEPFTDTTVSYTNVENTQNFITDNDFYKETAMEVVYKEIQTKNEQETYENIVKKRENELNNKKNSSNQLMLDFVEYKKMNRWPSKTTIPCMHDGYEFSGMPYGIPIKIENGICYMSSNCCSPSCAAALNFDTNYDNNAYERYSLMNYIYNDNRPIFIANSKLLLDKWGGSYSISNFRNLNNSFKRINIEVYPFVASIPTVEETKYDLDTTAQNIVSIDKDKLKKVTSDYRLRRSKPLPEFKNTLESCMNLKFV
jgi:hypothetical protein